MPTVSACGMAERRSTTEIRIGRIKDTSTTVRTHSFREPRASV